MELYINDTLVDLNERVPFPLTFNISDIRDLSNRKGSSSKTIQLPGTRINTKLMSSVFSLSTTSADGQPDLDSFDPSIKASARYYENGVLQFQGICQLTECTRLDGVWTFSIVLFADQVDIVTLLKNYKIKELGWEEYNHKYTYANQQSSWSGTIQKNGVNYNNYSGTDWLGEGYYYGLIDYGFDRPLPESFPVDTIPPQVFIKSIVDKMFEKIGVTYDSTFFETQQFKRLLLAYEGGVLPTIDSATATANSVTTDQVNTVGTFIFDQQIGMIDNPYSDQFSLYFSNFITQYSSDSGTTVDPAGQVQSEIPFKFVSDVEGDFTLTYSGDHIVNIDFTITNGSGSHVINTTPNAYLRIKKNGVLYQEVQLWTNPIVNSTSVTNAFTSTFSTQVDLNLDVSDVIECDISYRLEGNTSVYDSTATSIVCNTDVMALKCGLDISYNEQTITAGSTINIKQFLPDMDCATFFKGLITMFNLYVKPDVSNPFELNIEPLNSFYNGSNNAIDWTDLVDHSKEFKVTPTVNFSTKEYNLKFTEDADYWNARYFTDVVRQYGSKQILSPSQFSTGSTDFVLPFSNKLLGNIPDTDLIVPRNFQVKTDEDGISEITERRGKAFIVQIKVGNVGTLETGDWNHIDESDVSHAETNYPYVGHLDSITSPTFDLMFGVPSYVFYDVPAGVTYTTNNLYLYHEKYIKELTSKHGKMLTCYVNINSSMIKTLDFGDLIKIDGIVYRLQKIENYESGTDASTRCEFIRLIEGESIQTYTIDMEFDPYVPVTVKLRRITEDGEQRDTEDGLDARRIE